MVLKRNRLKKMLKTTSLLYLLQHHPEPPPHFAYQDYLYPRTTLITDGVASPGIGGSLRK